PRAPSPSPRGARGSAARHGGDPAEVDRSAATPSRAIAPFSHRSFSAGAPERDGSRPARESGPAATLGAPVPVFGLQPALEVRLRFFAPPAVVLLELADQDVAVALDAVHVVGRQLAPLLADLPLELHPVAFQHVLVHLSSSDGNARRRCGRYGIGCWPEFEQRPCHDASALVAVP